eukprot:4677351-Pyramimonas_sp.AAC.1
MAVVVAEYVAAVLVEQDVPHRREITPVQCTLQQAVPMQWRNNLLRITVVVQTAVLWTRLLRNIPPGRAAPEGRRNPLPASALRPGQALCQLHL